ncbi:unnamed protein product, partial [Rotaria magnacalcarata]
MAYSNISSHPRTTYSGVSQDSLQYQKPTYSSQQPTYSHAEERHIYEEQPHYSNEQPHYSNEKSIAINNRPSGR